MFDSPDFGSLMIKGFIIYGLIWLVDKTFSPRIKPGWEGSFTQKEPYKEPFPGAAKKGRAIAYWSSVAVYITCSAFVSGRADAQSWAWNSAFITMGFGYVAVISWMKRNVEKK